MAAAFISYSSTDIIFANLAKAMLQGSGITVWLDSGELKAGEEWRDAIDRGISSADAVVVILTPDSCASPYVTYEWGFALGKEKPVIPILLTESNVHPRLDVLQYIDFQDHKSLPWDKLISEINENAAEQENDDSPEYVRDLTTEDLQDIIAGAISLSNATQNRTGQVKPEDITKAADSVVNAVQNPSYKEILWVDDRPNNNIYERNAFELVGYEITLALSTNEALEILEHRYFSAIISDMGRKEGVREGYALLEAFRKKDKDTPFIIYAGSNAPEHKREAIKRGAQGSTNRPQELFDLILKYITIQPSPLAQSPETGPCYNPIEKRSLF